MIYFVALGIGIVIGLALASKLRKNDDWSDIYEYL